MVLVTYWKIGNNTEIVVIKNTCFHPYTVAINHSTMIQWDLESQESLEREIAKNKHAFLEWNSIVFLAVQIDYRMLLVYSKYNFLWNIFYWPENRWWFFFFFGFICLFFNRTEFHCCKGDRDLFFFPLCKRCQIAEEKQVKIRIWFLSWCEEVG